MLTMPKSSRCQLGTSGRTKNTGANAGASGFAHSARYRLGLWHLLQAGKALARLWPRHLIVVSKLVSVPDLVLVPDLVSVPKFDSVPDVVSVTDLVSVDFVSDTDLVSVALVSVPDLVL